MTTLHLQCGGDAEPTVVTMTWSDDRASCAIEIEGRRIDAEVIWTDEQAGFLRRAGRIVPFAVRRDGDVIELVRGGRRDTVTRQRRTARRAEGASAGVAANTLKAPMPGKILEVRCQAGATFEAHEAIVVMESMKMEMTLSVPSPGRVREVLCAEGELVEVGELLAQLEFEAEPAP